jgi:hypothetical protein
MSEAGGRETRPYGTKGDLAVRRPGGYQPIGLPLFCSSSHFWSGAK